VQTQPLPALELANGHNRDGGVPASHCQKPPSLRIARGNPNSRAHICLTPPGSYPPRTAGTCAPPRPARASGRDRAARRAASCSPGRTAAALCDPSKRSERPALLPMIQPPALTLASPHESVSQLALASAISLASDQCWAARLARALSPLRRPQSMSGLAPTDRRHRAPDESGGGVPVDGSIAAQESCDAASC
jgi:hypothetical protein